jgi:large conductance mechanosensitive channel
MLKDFKEFALKGNVMDMAVGIIIGAGFAKIVNSFVTDILMPPLGLLLGKVDFGSLFIDLSRHGYKSLAEAKLAGAATLNYGLFINTVIDFTLVAFAIFLVISQMNRMKKAQAVAPPAPISTKDCVYCFTPVPLKAIKCPHCTSDLKAIAA